MEVANLNVKPRSEFGGRKVNHVRARGEIPAVIYGLGRDAVHLAVPGRQFHQLIHTHHKLFELHMDGGVEEAYLQDLQWDEITDEILHVDFKRIDLSAKLQSIVDVHYVGQPKGLAKNGVFEAPLQQLQVECLPRDLPEEIRLNVNTLDIGESITVQDLKLPDGVVALVEPDTLVCLCKLRHESLAEDEDAPAEGPAEPEVIGKKKDDE